MNESKLSILVVDDESSIRRVLELCLKNDGHETESAQSRAEAEKLLEDKSFDLCLLDVRLGNESGLEMIAPFQKKFPWMKIIIITAHATVESAVKAMKDGAVDYLPKPFSPEQVQHAVSKVEKIRELEYRVEELSSASPKPKTPTKKILETNNKRMSEVIRMAEDIADTDASVLIRGESGTGKTMLARLIHEASSRRNYPFIVVSCPSLSQELLESELFGHLKGSFTGAHRDYQGKIAAAQKGTLFLDEIGDMSPSLQAKMLRFVQDREYESVGDTTTKKADIRIITATNVNLEEAVIAGDFREDLLFRLNVIELDMLPLRERPEDIMKITENIIKEIAPTTNRKGCSFSDEATNFLLSYSWPGNIRELRNVIERCLLLSTSEEMDSSLLPMKLTSGDYELEKSSSDSSNGSNQSAHHAAPVASISMTLEALEEQHIKRVLAATKSLDEAAKQLGIDQTTLYRRRKAYGML